MDKYRWKERLKISKIAKFENQRGYSSSKSRNFTNVGMAGGRGGGTNLPHRHQ